MALIPKPPIGRLATMSEGKGRTNETPLSCGRCQGTDFRLIPYGKQVSYDREKPGMRSVEGLIAICLRCEEPYLTMTPMAPSAPPLDPVIFIEPTTTD